MKSYHTGEVRVGCSFEGTQAGTDDEGSATESSKGLGQTGGPHAESANSIENKAENEDRLVSIMAEDPIGVPKGG